MDEKGKRALLRIVPDKELTFPLVLNKSATVNLRIENISEENVAFKIKTTAPKSYLVRPNQGVVRPTETADIVIILQPMREEPVDNGDKFLVQSMTFTNDQANDLANLWSVADKKAVLNHRIKVVFARPEEDRASTPPKSREEDRPATTPSTRAVADASNTPRIETADYHQPEDEHSSYGGSYSKMNWTNPDPVAAPASSQEFVELQNKYQDLVKFTLKLTEERDSYRQSADSARRELEQAKRLRQRPAGKKADEGSDEVASKDEHKDLYVNTQPSSGFALWHILVAALLCFLLGRLV